jgi:hypothetical protein
MKHLFHLVSADVRRFRLLLAVWVLIQVVDTVFRGVRPALAPDPRLGTAVELLATVLFLTRWLGMVVIVPLVVQTHPLVGSDAFWMTRPIPWRALFASKVVLLGTTFVAVPALCELALMLASRVPVAEVPYVTLQTILFQSLWLVIVMALSTTTRNLARFALVAGSVLVALVLLINIAIAVMLRSFTDGPELTVMTGRSVASPTADVVMLMLLIIAAVAQLVVQYRTRSTRFSVGAGVTIVAVSVLIMLTWPSQERPLPVPGWASQESALRLVAESQQGEFRPLEDWSPWNPSDGWYTGGVRLRLSGVEEGWLATVRLDDGTVQFDDGTTLATVGNGYSSSVPFASVDDVPLRVVMRQVLGIGRVVEGSQSSLVAEAVPAIVVKQADFEKYVGATGTYHGRFLVDLDHIAIAATLPLRPGAGFQESRRRIVIDQVVPQAQSASIRVRQFTAATMFDSSSPPRVSFYLRNRDTDEAVAGMGGHGGIGTSSGLGLPLLFGLSSYSAGPGSGFSISTDSIRFPEGYRSDDHVVVISADWLSHAELVIVHTVHAGTVTRALEISGFEIAAAPPRLPR